MDSGNCGFGVGILGMLFLVAAMLVVGGDALAGGVYDELGFERIFNGRDLSGWDGDPRFWSIKDGALRGETTKKASAPYNTFCIWRGGRLENFVLKVKFRIQNGNSGIQYR
ncbi:MAG: DUF1080 domain-containing protein, partial [Planctomycetes bacterium]|nr:DUF1080 domain-containing protein [Planctomycetota bacterium]